MTEFSDNGAVMFKKTLDHVDFLPHNNELFKQNADLKVTQSWFQTTESGYILWSLTQIAPSIIVQNLVVIGHSSFRCEPNNSVACFSANLYNMRVSWIQ